MPCRSLDARAVMAFFFGILACHSQKACPGPVVRSRKQIRQCRELVVACPFSGVFETVQGLLSKLSNPIRKSFFPNFSSVRRRIFAWKT